MANKKLPTHKSPEDLKQLDDLVDALFELDKETAATGGSEDDDLVQKFNPTHDEEGRFSAIDSNSLDAGHTGGESQLSLDQHSKLRSIIREATAHKKAAEAHTKAAELHKAGNAGEALAASEAAEGLSKKANEYSHGKKQVATFESDAHKAVEYATSSQKKSQAGFTMSAKLFQDQAVQQHGLLASQHRAYAKSIWK